MVKKPPEKPFQIKIFKMAVESDQVGIQRKSKTANFAWFKKVNFAQNKHIRWLSMVNRQKGKAENCYFQGSCYRYSLGLH